MAALAAVLVIASLGGADAVSYTRLHFVENRGEVDRAVSYYVEGRDSTYFTAQGATFTVESATVALDFVGARHALRPEAHGSTVVAYRDAWPGIDVSWSGTAGRLEDTFVVRPGADTARIRLRYRGASSMRIAEDGGLAVTTHAGDLRVEAPRAYQEIDGAKREVEVGFALKDTQDGFEYGFSIKPYDHSRTLVIDPVVLAYCGYIGGSGDDGALGVAVDAAGNAYVTGSTTSSETTFPVSVGPDLTYQAGADVFVAKVKADGTGLIYAGYIGGMGQDYGRGIAVDSTGSAYIVGATFSPETNFPVIIGPDLTYNGDPNDAFVTKVKADGTGLVYAGYIGGDVFDTANSIAVDTAGSAYVTGETISTEASFPVLVGPDLTHNGFGYDAFVAKVAADGSGLVYAGYIGGPGDDEGFGIAVDSAGSAYVGGFTSSAENTFPVTVGPDVFFNGADDAFAAKVKPDGTGLVYAGYIGGSDRDEGYGIAVDGAGKGYVSGITASSETTFPVSAGPDLTFNGGLLDIFVARVRADGTGLEYAGYIGGSGTDFGWGIAVDFAGAAYVTGRTDSSEATFPVTTGPDLTFNGGGDAFVAEVKPDGTSLDYAGYLGGLAGEEARGIAVDGVGSAYVAGGTGSSEATFPVTVGPDVTYNGGLEDAFVAKIAIVPCATAAAPVTHLKAVRQPSKLDDIDFTWDPDPLAAGYNIWYVTLKTDIPASQATSPPSIGVIGCAVPSPAGINACNDVGGVSRSAPTIFFYQVHTYCDANSEGP